MRLIALRNARGTEARLADLGAAIVAIDLVGPSGLHRMVLGPEDPEHDLAGFAAAGSIVGRVANRIANARFALDGVEHVLPANDGRHHLHGGPHGFGVTRWSAEPVSGAAARFRLVSPDGDQGYPGRLAVTVTYRLDDDDTLAIAYEATADRATPVNLTNHVYFNLGEESDVLGHELWLDADRWLPIDRETIPTGEVRPVAGTACDFRAPRRIGERFDALETDPIGYDHYLVFRSGRDLRRACARLHDPGSGRTLEVVTDQPGVQLYTGNYLGALTGAGGRRYRRHGGVCLETQHFPDAVHHAEFPSTILRPGERYASETRLRFRTGWRS